MESITCKSPARFDPILNDQAVKNAAGGKANTTIEEDRKSFLATPLFLDADFWINRIDANGLVTASERLRQQSHTKNGQLNFLDNGHLGLLIKITSLTAPAPRQSPDVIPD